MQAVAPYTLCMVMKLRLFYNQQKSQDYLLFVAQNLTLWNCTDIFLESSCQIQIFAIVLFHLLNFVPSINPL